jgi:hypothetical protein
VGIVGLAPKEAVVLARKGAVVIIPKLVVLVAG